MTITLSDLGTLGPVSISQNVKCTRRLNLVPASDNGSTISTKLESIRLVEPSRSMSAGHHVRDILEHGRKALSTSLSYPGSDTLVIKFASLRETDSAFLIHSLGSENIIIIPKSFSIPADLGFTRTRSLEVFALRGLGENYFFATSFRLLSN